MPILNKKEYQCDLCKGIFNLVQTQEEADEEYKKEFPNASMKNREIVCDDCWKLVRPQ